MGNVKAKLFLGLSIAWMWPYGPLGESQVCCCSSRVRSAEVPHCQGVVSASREVPSKLRISHMHMHMRSCVCGTSSHHPVRIHSSYYELQSR